MSPEQPIHTGWHDIDEQPVPVRVGAAAADASSPPASSADDGVPSTAGVSPRAMQAAAMLGVGIVLIATAFYVGIDSLRGSLTGNVTTVTITQDGHFSPSSIRVAAGSMLTIENKNRDPQVLKAKSGAPLFPVQVLFETPYSFTVPVDAGGTYLYFSETLIESETLTITVLPSIESTAASAGSAVSNRPIGMASDQIPIPFGDGHVSSAQIPIPFGDGHVSSASVPWQSSAPRAPVVSATTSSVSRQSPAAVSHVTDTAMINIATAQAETDASLRQNQLPTNPYTVAAAKNGINRHAQIASNAKAKLHGAAPLSQYRPKAVTQTGPEIWLLLLPAIFALCMAYRRWSVMSA